MLFDIVQQKAQSGNKEKKPCYDIKTKNSLADRFPLWLQSSPPLHQDLT